MPRVIGIDPGTVSIDLCGLDDGAVMLDRTLPTADALADPESFVELLEEAGPLDLVAGPSGYGLPLVRADEAGDDELRLAYLAVEGETGGIGGLRRLARALARSAIPVVFTPGVVHLASVPAHRKVNRVDMGTADKVCAAALAMHDQARRTGRPVGEASFLLLELGGAFTSAIAVERGRIVDGVGGSSGPIGVRSAGALDGEVAFLAGHVPRAMLFRGGASAVAGDATSGWLRSPGVAQSSTETLEAPARPQVARRAYLEGALKAVASLLISVPEPREILVTGRMAEGAEVLPELTRQFGRVAPARMVAGFAPVTKAAAQGAALLADGLAGGAARELVETLGLRDARGTALDHLYVVDPDDAWRRLRGEA